MPNALQTREQFLAQLPQLIDLPDDADGTCTICIGECHQPMEVCEKHIFCRACINKWLTEGRTNTCPICRRVLFARPNVEDVAAAEDEELTVEEVFDLIEIQSGLRDDDFPLFGAQGITRAQVSEVVPDARVYLSAPRRALVPAPTATALLDERTINIHLAAMGNLLGGHAVMMNRPYTERELPVWWDILEEVRACLCSYPHKEVTGDELATFAAHFLPQMERNMDFLWDEGWDEEVDAFFEADAHRQSPTGDLIFLVEYVLYQCINAYQGRVLFDAMLY